MEMTKVMSLVKARGFSTSSDFRAYWADEYLRSLLAVSDMREKTSRVVHNHAVPIQIPEATPRGADGLHR
jgi:hypothetical protein